MTRLLEIAIAEARKLPEALQDLAAKALLRHAEEPSAGDIASIDEGRRAFARGDVVHLGNKWLHAEWSDDMESVDR